jgi:hypothetical protein
MSSDKPYVLEQLTPETAEKTLREDVRKIEKPYDLFHSDILPLCRLMTEFIRQNPKFIEDAIKHHSKGSKRAITNQGTEAKEQPSADKTETPKKNKKNAEKN